MLADAHGLVVAHLAAFVHLAAVLEVGAGIATLAGLRVTGESGRAVLIGAAATGLAGPWNDRVASWIRVAGRLRHADVALRTRAAWLVQHDATESVDAAGATQGARVQALCVYAGFLVRTLGVAGTFLFFIFHSFSFSVFC